jgi:hypothetical protein
MDLSRVFVPRTDDGGRMTSGRAKFQIALSVVVLLIGVGGVLLNDGWHAVAYGVAFGAMALGNLAWAVGSLIPDGPRARLLRAAVVPLSVVMLVALAITLGFQFGWLT